MVYSAPMGRLSKISDAAAEHLAGADRIHSDDRQGRSGDIPPDGVVIVDDVAVLTRDGGPGLEQALRRCGKRVVRIQPPGRVDGRDVVRAGNMFFIGLSRGTDRAGAVQLGACLSGMGHASRILDTIGGKFLRAGVAYAGDSTLLVDEAYRLEPAFRDFKCVVSDAGARFVED